MRIAALSAITALILLVSVHIGKRRLPKKTIHLLAAGAFTILTMLVTAASFYRGADPEEIAAGGICTLLGFFILMKVIRSEEG
ncbi:hypothetical protein [Alkalicoccus urumqiensis]|uniref:Uncharacterized protein n=1 Tax=Alkalicoccus urumqiensis TaxID=1548213 RepID=A0A2P6MGR0_ALKUR|nr:hypothetical protein [Alkalicoccus urumqiensis]PRO65462.1 hypothetical protein C6I21_09915 [Alkalicoccus urumqiensis]